ncbi:MAG: anhydro-N-acetylmuramic acid kinase [bacterium]
MSISRLEQVISKTERRVVGLMSGTSVDGVDAALVKIAGHGFDTQLELMHFLTWPYPEGLKEEIIKISTPGHGRVEEICIINVLVGEIFAEAVHRLLKEAGVDSKTVDLIGSHGQTIHHLPEAADYYNYKIRSTLQVGEPAVISQRTGIVTVADFRPADLAAGGQGAPLVPYFDLIRFRSTEKNRALLNLGGIANMTVLKKNCQMSEVRAFDTGPANMVVDALMQRLFNQPFDRDGRIAQSGSVSVKLLRRSLQHEYFHRQPPKSTGREMFGQEFCERFVKEADDLKLPAADILATAVELTVASIRQNYESFIAPFVEIEELIVSGGGAKNPYLMRSLKDKFEKIPIRIIDEFGVPLDAKEAVCFAVLANETVNGIPNNVPAATGATRPVIMGKICL